MSVSQETVRVLERLTVAPGVCELVLEAPSLATALRPGQFVMLLSEAAGAPYLARPQ